MAIFGNTNEIGGGDTNHGVNYKAVSKYTLSEYGAIKSISLLLRGDVGTSAARGIIYSDNSGNPDILKAVSEELPITVSSIFSWYIFNFPYSITLSPGDYWLGMIVGTTESPRYYNHVVTNNRKYNPDTYSDGPSDPFGGGITTDEFEITVFVTYVKQNIVPSNRLRRGSGW